jgi:hypothetical protein
MRRIGRTKTQVIVDALRARFSQARPGVAARHVAPTGKALPLLPTRLVHQAVTTRRRGGMPRNVRG